VITILTMILCSAWTETFDTCNYFPPDNWLVVNEDALDAVWYRALCEAHSGIYAAACYYDTAYSGLSYTNLDYLITPRVLPQGSDTLVSFWYVSTTTAPCTLDIMISTSSPPSMPDFTVERTILLADTTWTLETVSLGAYSNTPVYIAFRVRRIPLLQAIGLDDITLPDITTQPFICNGRLRTKGPPSQKYLQVWGSNYEMGFAHGYLLAEEIMAVWIHKWIGNSSYHGMDPISYQYGNLPWYREKYYTPDKFQWEADGVIDGMDAKGVSRYHPALYRDLTAEDLLTIACGGDTTSFLCSSLSGWGESTINDDTLQGGFVIARNVDGRQGLYTTLANVSLIIAYSPSDPNEQKFFNVSMAGIFGAFSCLNENGVGLCQNTGNHPDTAIIPPNSLLGDFLSSRLAVEMKDPDGSGVNDIYDIDSMKIPSEHFRSTDIHLYSLYNGSHPIPGAILEINQIADSLRFATHNYLSPPIYSQWNLVVTNHDRVLYPPVSCWRYQRVADSLNANYWLTTQRVIQIANTVTGGYNFSNGHCTYHSMAIRPNVAVEHPDWPCVGVSYARRYQAAHTQDKVWYSWNDLFEGVPGIKEVVKKPVNKTVASATIVSGPLRMPKDCKYRIYDITGRIVTSAKIQQGIYFIKVDGGIVHKIIKIK